MCIHFVIIYVYACVHPLALYGAHVPTPVCRCYNYLHVLPNLSFLCEQFSVIASEASSSSEINAPMTI